MDIVILIGLQGAGKSTFYQRHFAATHAYVSRDRLRNNRRPRRREQELIRQSLRERRSIVVDNTHPTAADRAPIIALAREFGARTIGYYFESRLEPCLARNRQREGKSRVPDVALIATAKNFEIPRLAEGFDELHYVRIGEDGKFRVEAWQDASDATAPVGADTMRS
jgi:predicted kinase